MSQEQLEAVAITKDEFVHYSTNELMNYFVNKNTCRKNTFWESRYTAYCLN